MSFGPPLRNGLGIGMGATPSLSSGQSVSMESGAFFAPLQTTLVPSHGVGPATFTRATTGLFTDFEDVLRTAPSGAARFTGARMVRNLVGTTSEDLSNAAWGKTSVTTSVSTNTSNSGTLMYKLIESAGSSVHEIANNVSIVAANIYIFSYEAKAGERGGMSINYAGVGLANFNLLTGVVNATASNGAFFTSITAGVVTLANGNYRCWVRATAVSTLAGSTRAEINTPATFSTIGQQTYVGDGTSGIYLTSAQVENVTGQSVQTVGEYVSVGVLSTPWHGAGVDGVKYFSTTLAGTTVPYPIKGYLAEPTATNKALWSNDATNAAWVFTGGTKTANLVAPDGTLTGVSCSGSSSVAPTQTVATAGTATGNTYSIYTKWVSGSDTRVFMLRNDTTAADFATGTISYSAGTVAGTGWTIEPKANGWYRLAFPRTTGINASDTLKMYFGSTTALATNDGTWGVWGMQLEAGITLTTLIPTTTIAVARNADVLTYPSAGNTTATVGSAYAELSVNWATGTGGTRYAIQLQDSGGRAIYSSGSAVYFSMYDGTAALDSNAPSTYTDITRKLASSWGGSTKRNVISGGTPASGSFDGQMGTAALTTIGIGCDPAGTNLWGGNIRNVGFWPWQLSANELALITAGSPTVILTEGGDVRITEGGDTRISG